MPSVGFGFNLFHQIHNKNTKCVDNICKLTYDIEALLFASWGTLVLLEGGKLICRGFFNKSFASNATSCVLQNSKLYYLEGNKLCCTELNSGENEKQTICEEHFKQLSGNFSGENKYAIAENGVLLRIKNDASFIFVTIKNNIKIEAISCGNDHVLALTTKGEVLSWGIGSRGQLGQGSLSDIKEPGIVDALTGVTIKMVKAGGWHSVVLSATGDLYSFGWNNAGQLGFDNDVTMLSNPTLLELEKYLKIDYYATFTRIDCGMQHTSAITVEGILVTWGKGAYGQLVRSRYDKNFNLPEKSDLLSKYKVTDVKCGPWNTFIKYD